MEIIRALPISGLRLKDLFSSKVHSTTIVDTSFRFTGNGETNVSRKVDIVVSFLYCRSEYLFSCEECFNKQITAKIKFGADAP